MAERAFAPSPSPQGSSSCDACPQPFLGSPFSSPPPARTPRTGLLRLRTTRTTRSRVNASSSSRRLGRFTFITKTPSFEAVSDIPAAAYRSVAAPTICTSSNSSARQCSPTGSGDFLIAPTRFPMAFGDHPWLARAGGPSVPSRVHLERGPRVTGRRPSAIPMSTGRGILGSRTRYHRDLPIRASPVSLPGMTATTHRIARHGFRTAGSSTRSHILGTTIHPKMTTTIK